MLFWRRARLPTCRCVSAPSGFEMCAMSLDASSVSDELRGVAGNCAVESFLVMRPSLTTACHSPLRKIRPGDSHRCKSSSLEYRKQRLDPRAFVEKLPA